MPDSVCNHSQGFLLPSKTQRVQYKIFGFYINKQTNKRLRTKGLSISLPHTKTKITQSPFQHRPSSSTRSEDNPLQACFQVLMQCWSSDLSCVSIDPDTEGSGGPFLIPYHLIATSPQHFAPPLKSVSASALVHTLSHPLIPSLLTASRGKMEGQFTLERKTLVGGETGCQCGVWCWQVWFSARV